jgi:hypothetical protein
VVRLNAARYGILARDVVLPGEDADAFEDLRNQVRADLSPVGPIEEFLADRVVNTMWRLQCVVRAETALLHSRTHALKADRLREHAAIDDLVFMDPPWSRRTSGDKAASEVAAELEQAEYERDRDEVLLGLAIDADAKEGDAFGKLARYERNLERSLLRALDELRQLQDRRRKCPAPAIFDAVTLDAGDTD